MTAPAPEHGDAPEVVSGPRGETPVDALLAAITADPALLADDATRAAAARLDGPGSDGALSLRRLVLALREAKISRAKDLEDFERAASEKRKAAAAKDAPAPRRRPRADFERGDHPELGCAMLADLPSDARPVFALGAVHAYGREPGIWTLVERSEESRTLQRYAGAWVAAEDAKAKQLRLKASDVKGSIELAHDQAAAPRFFDDAPSGLAFGNGFVRFVDGKPALVEHAPDNRARFSYPFPYDPSAPCARWLAFLEEVFRGDTDATEKIACLQEYAGASLVGIAATYQKAMLQRGEGRNGKSVAGLVIAGSCAAGSVCCVPPQKWGEDYHRAHMMGARLNFVPELPESDILKADCVKSIIDGSPSTARNPYERVIPFVPRFGNLWNANALPATTDHSHAFWDRFIMIEYNRVFRDDEKVPDLEKTIMATEKPGIVAWELVGAERVMKQGRYTAVPSSIAAMSKWRHEADPIAMFLEARTRPAVSHRERERCDIIYQRFAAWCGANGHKPMSSTKFGTRMRQLGRASEPGHEGYVYPVTLLPNQDAESEDFMLRKMGHDVGLPAELPPDPDSFHTNMGQAPDERAAIGEEPER